MDVISRARNLFFSDKLKNVTSVLDMEMDSVLFLDVYLLARVLYFNPVCEENTYHEQGCEILKTLFLRDDAVMFVIERLKVFATYPDALLARCENPAICQAVRGYIEIGAQNK